MFPVGYGPEKPGDRPSLRQRIKVFAFRRFPHGKRRLGHRRRVDKALQIRPRAVGTAKLGALLAGADSRTGLARDP